MCPIRSGARPKGDNMGMQGFDNKDFKKHSERVNPGSHVNHTRDHISAKNLIAKVRTAFSVPAFAPAIA